SVHTLAVAAYEIVHAVSKKRDPNRRDLLLDTDFIKDEFRSEWTRLLRMHANFFKHGDRDPDAVIDFNPELTEWFILFAILGLRVCGERMNDEESVFLSWVQIHRPHFLTESGRQFIANTFSANTLAYVRTRPKREFFDEFMKARRQVNQ